MLEQMPLIGNLIEEIIIDMVIDRVKKKGIKSKLSNTIVV